jgi:bcr-type benzoyl-CoA reductase subunit C
MTDISSILTEFEKLSKPFSNSSVIKEWKESGKKVIAFECTYVPEEIIYAAGALPVRLIGDSQLSNCDDASAYMYSNTCSFIRSCLQLVLKNQYEFLDGFVAGSTCDCSRRLADVWEHYHFTPFMHTIGVPRKITSAAYELYEKEVREFVRCLEEFTGAEITSEALQKAIVIYNRRRELFKILYQMNKSNNPSLTGSEMLVLLNASVSVPPEQFNNLLKCLISQLGSQPVRIRGDFRIMVSGSPLNNPEFIKAVEEQGGLVVIDELCTGIRYWWEGVNLEVDPLKVLCRRYLHNFACPRMEPSDDRLQRIARVVRDYQVDAVITQMVRYCVPQTMEQPLVRDLLKEMSIPVLELDIEYGMGGTGQITTRLQAFFEMLRGKRTR